MQRFSFRTFLAEIFITQSTDYGVWGDVLREQKVDERKYRFGYQGQFAERDEETGWNHFELREYDPVIGRWLVPDPAKQYFSPYVAFGNNPINRTDPDGGTDNPFGKSQNVISDFKPGPYSSIDLDGNIFSVIPSLDYLLSDGVSPFDLGIDWLTGTGDEFTIFVNDEVANAMRDADKVSQAREFFYAKACKELCIDGLTVTNFRGNSDILRGNFGIEGIWKAGKDDVEQYVGSYSIAIHSNGEFLTFTLMNKSSMNSAGYGVLPEYKRGKFITPGGNTSQWYIFTEKVSFERLDFIKK